MKQLTLREIQLGQLEVLKKIKEICEHKGLKYYLFYGTLIGAVRHKGFIPWDDDIDIVMFRPDYDKFISYCIEHSEELKPFELHHYLTNRRYIYPIARFSDSRYYVEYNTADDYGLGLFVDIYPFDGCGSTEKEIHSISRRHRPLIVSIIYGGKQFEKSSNFFKTAIKFIVWILTRLIGVNLLLRINERIAKKDISNSKYVECVVWELEDYNRYEMKDFGNGVALIFENEQFTAPCNYDAILKKEYGNYMILPPEKERIGHHYFKTYIKDEYYENK